MKLDRFNRSYFEQGEALAVVENVEDGQACLLLNTYPESLLFQFPANKQYVFKNPKRADGIVFFPDGQDTWGILLVELKRTVSSRTWEDIKLQWHGAWLHALGIAGVLELQLSGRVEVMVGYRHEKLSLDHADAILLKVPSTHAFAQMNEWAARQIELEELGSTPVHTIALDPVSGEGQYHFN
jgi:hypothetical protein